MSKNEKLFDDLQKFFIEVNKIRTDIMKKENPYDSYEYFSKDENPELIIRRGMTQYEDLVKHFKRMERKERKLSRGSENSTPRKISNEIEIEDKKEIIQKLEFSDKKEKIKENKIDKQEIKEEKDDEKNKVDFDNFLKNPEEGYEYSQIETSEYELSPEIKIIAKWYYINKKKIQNEELLEEEKNINDSNEEEEKVCIKIKTTSKNILILHWGIYKSNHGLNWFKPPKESYPPDTKEFDRQSVETEFPEEGDRSIQFILPRGKGLKDYIGGVNFVIYDPIKNIWYNNYRKDYQIKFKIKIDKKVSKMILMKSGLYVPDFVLDVINCEANYGSWTLMHRYNKCNDIIRNWNVNDKDNENNNQSSENWIWIYIWLRYSFLRQLDWQRNYNTRPALLSEAMSNLSDLLTRKYSEFNKNENKYRNLIENKSFIIKNILSLLGKGTGNGQEIRDEILKIMHRNKMSKSPEKNFYEQWHQKLHNNTTPDDIVICEAVINFLKSKGDINVYWKTLKEGGISKERLASYERNITSEPFYSPNYNIKDFENYLKILKSVHASTDLYMTYEGCKNYIGNNAINKMEEILKNKEREEIIPQLKRVTELREELDKIIKDLINKGDNMKLREVLFLEISLELYVRQLVEKMIHIKLDFQEYSYKA